MLSSRYRPLILLLALAIFGCTEPSVEPNPSDADPELAAFFEAVFERRVAQSPEQQSRLGRKTDRLGEWDDRSDAFAAQQLEVARQDLEQLKSEFDRQELSASDQLSYDLFVFNVERSLRNHQYRRHAYVVDQFNGQLTDPLTLLQNDHPIATLEDAESYLARVEGLEALLAELVWQLRDRADFGVVPPAFSFPAMLTDARSISAGTPMDASAQANPLWSDFTAKLDRLEIDPAQKEALVARGEAAWRGPFRRGFALLIEELERLRPVQLENQGVWSLPDGDAYYANRIRSHTTLDLTADEVHQIGLDEVARIHAEMDAIRIAVGFEGGLREFFAFVRTDPNNFYENSDAGRAAFLAEAESQTAAIFAVADRYFHRLPEAGLEVRRVEPWRQNSTSIAFYNRPPEDGSRPGIYYANLADMAEVQKYVFTAITYHEGVPGHHFQIALAQELDGLPLFRKYSGYGAYTEGWALYAEQLAKEMGFYQEPMRDFGRLQNELWRAARLVIDTGIHAKRWTREQAIDYFKDNTPLSDGDVVTEVERFFVNPGQALGYKIGMIKILELRTRAREALGDRFDLRDFHDAVIGVGALPLPILEQRVTHFIEHSQ